MGQGDNIENLKDCEIAEALKEIDAERARERVERQIFNNNSVNFSRIRPTEMKFNTKVNPPTESTMKSEAAILVQSDAVRREIAEYIDNNEVKSVLTDEEQEGKQSISDRVKKGELIVTFTDKDREIC